MGRRIQHFLFTLLFIYILASIPLIFKISNGNIEINISNVLNQSIILFSNILKGDISILETQMNTKIIEPAGFTFILLVSSMFISLVFSLLFGLFLQKVIFVKWLINSMKLLAKIPDFVIILVAMLAAVNFYKFSGYRIITINNSGSAINLWFPILILSITPTVYLIKNIDSRYHQIASEDYIKTAISKGLSVNYINLHHVYKNIKPYLLTDLSKALSLSLVSLFIIEYLLNVSGLTKHIFMSDYSLELGIVNFSVLILIAILCYLILRLILFFFEKGFIHE